MSEENQPAPTPEPIPAPPAPAPVPQNIPVEMPAAPPASEVVIKGTKSERELELEKKLSDADAARKQAEIAAAHAQDEAHRLKELQSQNPKPTQKKIGVGWWTEND